MGNHNDTHGHGGAAHGSVKEYVTGLILSIILTVIPFGLVMTGAVSVATAMVVILICGFAQLLVQAVFFLHLNTSSEQSWNLSTGIYTLFIFVLLLVGSMWIFTHLHHNILMGH
ncbi:MAG: cytochrome o ubiquinol oxidase subunit IV [Gammaproteobacteria bacterium]|nr:MAG: cytochrome o ubiquinol oxidase subunit IV [Gammaproteobacteria bacterium]